MHAFVIYQQSKNLYPTFLQEEEEGFPMFPIWNG